ncbi:phage integrase, partial [mine drainage metagenome]
ELAAAGLAPMSVRHIHAELHRALEQGVRRGAVARNVAALVDPPQAVRSEMRPLTPEQVRALLAAARGDRLEALCVLAGTTGMRRGELLGLRWADVDLAGGAAGGGGLVAGPGVGILLGARHAAGGGQRPAPVVRPAGWRGRGARRSGYTICAARRRP